MLVLIGLLITIYAEARLFDQVVNGSGWATRIVAVLSMIAMAAAMLILTTLAQDLTGLPVK